MASEWFSKPFEQISQRDIEEFILNLERGIITHGKNAKPYALETQATIKKFIKKFWKCLKNVALRIKETIRYMQGKPFDDLVISIVEEPNLQKQRILAQPFISKNANV